MGDVRPRVTLISFDCCGSLTPECTYDVITQLKSQFPKSSGARRVEPGVVSQFLDLIASCNRLATTIIISAMDRFTLADCFYGFYCYAVVGIVFRRAYKLRLTPSNVCPANQQHQVFHKAQSSSQVFRINKFFCFDSLFLTLTKHHSDHALSKLRASRCHHCICVCLSHSDRKARLCRRCQRQYQNDL